MTTASTVYDVVTRFSTERTGVQGTVNAARGVETALHRVERQAKHTRVATVAALSPMARAGRFLSPLLMLGRGMLGPLGALTAVGAVGTAMAKSFSNLNAELNTSLSLGAQFATAFEFSKDPIQNMVQSLAVGQGFMRQMARDAARLPGELSDFQAAMSMLGLPILAAGGGLPDVRRTLANLSIVAPMAGQSMEAGGRQTMRMLTGQTSIGDNPLFATLLGAGLLPGAKEFNALPAAERFERLDRALETLASNPLFRERLIRTFDVQLGTLADNLFGIQGILGKLGRGPFNTVLDGLVALNEGIEKHGDAFVGKVRSFVGELSKLGDLVPVGISNAVGGLFDLLGAKLQSGAKLLGLAYDATLGSERLRAGVMTLSGAYPSVNDPTFAGNANFKMMSPYERALAEIRRRDAARGPLPPMIEGINQSVLEAAMGNLGKDAPRKTPTLDPARTVTQIDKIEIRVDVKTDASPEAIAVAIDRAMQKKMTRPTMGKGGPRTLVPSMSGTP